MPNINIYNVEKKEVLEVAKKSVKALSSVVDSPVDWFNFMGSDSFIVVDNVVTNDFCYVVVDWFKRSKNVEQEVVNILTDALNDLGYKDVTIYFNELSSDNYYENKEKV